MSTPTTNYGLIKAAEGEQYDVDITNNNLDAIDTQIKLRADGIKLALQVIGIHGPSTTWGTLPTLASDIKVIFGSAPFTSDASGYIGVDMPASFANGYTVVAMMNGDGTANSNVMYQLSTGVFTNIANRFYVRTIRADSGVAIASQTSRLNYLVIGH